MLETDRDRGQRPQLTIPNDRGRLVREAERDDRGEHAVFGDRLGQFGVLGQIEGLTDVLGDHQLPRITQHRHRSRDGRYGNEGLPVGVGHRFGGLEFDGRCVDAVLTVGGVGIVFGGGIGGVRIEGSGGGGHGLGAPEL